MGKKADKGKKACGPAGSTVGKVAALPKKECCVSRTKCNRCPLRMLKEGTLPEGYDVKKRRLVRADTGKPVKKMKELKELKPAGSGKKGRRAA
jgi:hypothetical protein